MNKKPLWNVQIFQICHVTMDLPVSVLKVPLAYISHSRMYSLIQLFLEMTSNTASLGSNWYCSLHCTTKPYLRINCLLLSLLSILYDKHPMVVHLSGNKDMQCYVSPISNADHIGNTKMQIWWHYGELGKISERPNSLKTQINFETSLLETWKITNLEIPILTWKLPTWKYQY